MEVIIATENRGRAKPYYFRLVEPWTIAITREHRFTPLVVTHIPTGYAFPMDFETERAAVTAANRLVRKYGERLNTRRVKELRALIGSFENMVAVMKGRQK